MALISGAAIYKKKNGILSILDTTNPPKLQWIAAEQTRTNSKVELLLKPGTQLQASSANSDKMMLRLISPKEGGEPEKTVFGFTNRMIMDNVKESIRSIIEMQDVSKQTSQQAESIQLSMSQAKDGLEEILNPKKLLENFALQEKLLSSDPALKAVFKDTVINNGLDSKEFWKTRLHLLGTFALENQAKRGPYNVLSTINIVAANDNKFDLNVTREKIQFLFDQFPIVRKAYEENVPNILAEGMFWSRFFGSKLFRKLRGEKINKNEKSDQVFDQYLKITDEELNELDEQDRRRKLLSRGETSLEGLTVNRFIDVGKNEEDNSQKFGNRPDFTMRPEKDQEMVSIMRGFNRLSKKLVENVEDEENIIKLKKRKLLPEAELEEEEREKQQELALNDLQQAQEPEFVILNVNNPNNITQTQGKQTKIDVTQLVQLVGEMRNFFPSHSVDLKQVYKDRGAIEIANRSISTHIYNSSKQAKQNWQIFNSGSLDIGNVATLKQTAEALGNTQKDQIPSDRLKIPKEAVEELRLVHITSEEFLKHFWLHFNSGDPAQAGALRKLYVSVKKSRHRLGSVIQTIKNNTPESEAAEYEKYIRALVKPLLSSFEKAIGRYEEAESQAVSSNSG